MSRACALHRRTFVEYYTSILGLCNEICPIFVFVLGNGFKFQHERGGFLRAPKMFALVISIKIHRVIEMFLGRDYRMESILWTDECGKMLLVDGHWGLWTNFASEERNG